MSCSVFRKYPIIALIYDCGCFCLLLIMSWIQYSILQIVGNLKKNNCLSVLSVTLEAQIAAHWKKKPLSTR